MLQIQTIIVEITNLIQWSKSCNAKNTQDKIYKFNLSVFLKESGEFICICGLGPNDVNPAEVVHEMQNFEGEFKDFNGYHLYEIKNNYKN